MLVVFICRGDLDSANSNVLWVTAEAIPRVKDEGEFLETSRELIERLTREDVVHEFQDHKTDLEKLKESIGEITKYNGYMIFITPEIERYQGLVNGSEVVEVGISRAMGATAEVSHDEKGVIWPEAVAPFKTHVVSLEGGEKEADKLYHAFQKRPRLHPSKITS